jgi:mannose-6-phosphate isomerase-like protein (cupin superfamily)
MAETTGHLPVGAVCGNAARDGAARGGWFLGHFLPAADPRASEAVEVKWGVHRAGDCRAAWAVNHQATSLSVLVRGRFRLYLPQAEVLLTQPGDYLLWPPGVPHHWRAEQDSVVLTVRWPSRPADSQAAGRP